MSSQKVPGENQLFDAVKDLNPQEVEARVRRNAERMGVELSHEHLEVVHALIEHYQTDCQGHDCRAASPHMRHLIRHFEPRGGSRFLYRLFDAIQPSDETGRELGILTMIHELAQLPELTHNEDEGFGTVF
ncbi:MAG: hypothetical protein H6953_13105 [Chromatiaceae bacterium]|nr:hypothetical protein [Gammaproteobacteria bacterium]MCP5306373.1 hypothetical protein [Chromatiaceae bacterium]MCP5311925.1 hypothetical protein [Chromatiaceae bacterium]